MSVPQMASTEQGSYASRRTTSTYDDDDDDDEPADESDSPIHRLTAVDELSAGEGIDALATGGGPDRNAPNSWARFDEHIRRIATADPKEQYLKKKKSTDKASDTYRAALREFFRHEDSEGDDPNLSDSEDEELKLFAADANNNDIANDDPVCPTRNTPVETMSRRNWKGGKDGGLAWENGEMNNSSVKETSSACGGHHQSKQQQHQTDEYAVKRMVLYEKYLERDNAWWAEGLTNYGKEILAEIQRRKKRSKRVVVFAKSADSSRQSDIKSASRSKRSVSYHL